MRSRAPLSALRFMSLSFILIALVLTTLQLVRFSRVRAYLPAGMTIAGVPVGGLDRVQAAQRLLEAYSVPVEVRYNGAPVQFSPSTIEFQLDTDSMLAAAELQRTQKLFWQEFWDFLWGRFSTPPEVPLRASFSEARLRAQLTQIARVYDQPPRVSQPIPGTVSFEPGQPGTVLDVDGAVVLVERALYSLTDRSVELPLRRSDPGRPAMQNLQILLQQTIDTDGFDGLASVYLLDLQSAQELHFAYQDGKNLPVEPDIAFTASSIIKIPIMISSFIRMSEPYDEEAMRLMGEMIDKSGNEVSDWLMDRVIDAQRGPLEVTADLQALGIQNTFLAGYFTLGSPLLQAFQTPANQRADVNTDPDPYSQTTTSDMGMLLEDLYQCAETNGGALVANFPNNITQAECRTMINYLISNKLPVLITAGIPEGTQIAHKHGWVTTNGIINTIGDAAIVYSPGGNYVLVIFLYHSEQLIWNPASTLVARLSQAVYNYYNYPRQ